MVIFSLKDIFGVLHKLCHDKKKNFLDLFRLSLIYITGFLCEKNQNGITKSQV